MTTPLDEPLTPEPVTSQPPDRFTWLFTTIGIFVMLLICTALILVAAFHQ